MMIASDETSYLGMECWFNCGEQAGYCTWCGTSHVCCSRSGRDGVPECAETEGFIGEDPSEYQCVKAPQKVALKVDEALYGSVGMGSLKVDVTHKVNELLERNGVMDFTTGQDLNTVFGDPVPGVAKVLSITTGQHSQEFREAHDGNLYSLAPLLHQVMTNAPSFEQPSIYVAVLSRRVAETRRSLIRDMWSRAVGHSGNVTVKFALCKASDDLEYKVEAEQSIHGDILLLHCQEGDDEAKITQKVLMAMKEFRSSKPSRDIFMKVDDDTFVAWRRLSKFLTDHGTPMMYAGVPVDDTSPCRNPLSKSYEPTDTFVGKAYPKTMSGGAGYMLSKTVVQSILDEGIGSSNLLWNEERAVAVWVNALIERNIPIDLVTVPGLVSRSSWNATSSVATETVWKDYPFFLHHGLHGVTISCLSLADQISDPWHEIKNCFDVEVTEDVGEEKPSCWDGQGQA